MVNTTHEPVVFNNLGRKPSDSCHLCPFYSVQGSLLVDITYTNLWSLQAEATRLPLWRLTLSPLCRSPTQLQVRMMLSLHTPHTYTYTHAHTHSMHVFIQRLYVLYPSLISSGVPLLSFLNVPHAYTSFSRRSSKSVTDEREDVVSTSGEWLCQFFDHLCPKIFLDHFLLPSVN